VRIKSEGFWVHTCIPAPHALYSKVLTERTASRNVLGLFYYIFIFLSSITTDINPEPSTLEARWGAKGHEGSHREPQGENIGVRALAVAGRSCTVTSIIRHLEY